MFGAPIVELMRAPTLHAEDGYLIKTPKGFTNPDAKNSPPVDNLLVQPLGNCLGCGSAGRPCLDQNFRLAYMYVPVVQWSMIVKTVSARQANHEFSALLSRAERGEEILITKHNKPVAVLSPYRSPGMTAERKTAIQHALQLMKKGLPWGDALPRFARDQMHDR